MCSSDLEARQHNHGQHESREPNAKRERGQGQEGKPRANGADGRIVNREEVSQRFVGDMERKRDAERDPSKTVLNHV